LNASPIPILRLGMIATTTIANAIKMVKKFIQKIKIKKGALSRQLNIPEKKNIPLTLLNKIITAEAGQTIRNPTTIGKRRIKVTRLLERRAILARNLQLPVVDL